MHNHNHDHDQYSRSIERRFVFSIAITTLILAAEVVGGILSGSLALLSDAAHVFMDLFALALGYGAMRMATLPPDERHTYGFHRMKVIAAFVNGFTLLLIVLEIVREAWHRFQEPAPINTGIMLAVAVVGLVVNVVAAVALRSHHHDDLNARAAFLHVLGDAAASIGVIVGGAVIALTGWVVLDPVISLGIAGIVAFGAWGVLRNAIHILNEGAPSGISVEEVGRTMAEIPGVSAIHDLHVWTVAPGYVALSAHVVMEDCMISSAGQVLYDIKAGLHDNFGIEHTTIQFECGDCGQGAFECHRYEGKSSPPSPAG